MDERLKGLEEMVDAVGLDGVLRGLVEICVEKADHLRSNWQDECGARSWEKNAVVITKVVPRIVD